MRFSIILIALGFIDLTAFVAAGRTIAAWRAAALAETLALTFDALLTLVTLLPILPFLAEVAGLFRNFRS